MPNISKLIGTLLQNLKGARVKALKSQITAGGNSTALANALRAARSDRTKAWAGLIGVPAAAGGAGALSYGAKSPASPAASPASTLELIAPTALPIAGAAVGIPLAAYGMHRYLQARNKDEDERHKQAALSPDRIEAFVATCYEHGMSKEATASLLQDYAARYASPGELAVAAEKEITPLVAWQGMLSSRSIRPVMSRAFGSK